MGVVSVGLIMELFSSRQNALLFTISYLILVPLKFVGKLDRHVVLHRVEEPLLLLWAEVLVGGEGMVFRVVEKESIAVLLEFLDAHSHVDVFKILFYLNYF